MSMYNDIDWTAKDNTSRWFESSRVSHYGKKFPVRHWTFIGPETRKSGTGHAPTIQMAGGIGIAELFMLKFAESRYQVFRGTSPLRRWSLKCEGAGKVSRHFNAEHLKRQYYCCSTTIAVSQLSIYGAVPHWYNNQFCLAAAPHAGRNRSTLSVDSKRVCVMLELDGCRVAGMSHHHFFCDVCDFKRGSVTECVYRNCRVDGRREWMLRFALFWFVLLIVQTVPCFLCWWIHVTCEAHVCLVAHSWTEYSALENLWSTVVRTVRQRWQTGNLGSYFFPMHEPVMVNAGSDRQADLRSRSEPRFDHWRTSASRGAQKTIQFFLMCPHNRHEILNEALLFEKLRHQSHRCTLWNLCWVLAGSF